MKFEFSAGVVIYYQAKDHREYLVLHYPHGHWDFAKGHIEQGEDKVQAALRELQEETGIKEVMLDDIFEKNFEYFFKNKHGELIKKKVYFFIGHALHKEVIISHEHVGFAWLPFDKALKMLTFHNAQDLLTAVETYLSS